MSPWLQLLAIAVLYAGLFYVWYAVKTRRGLGAWLRKQTSQREIHVVESQGIGPRVSLTLVEVRGQSFLVAQSPQGVQMVPLDPAADMPSDFHGQVEAADRMPQPVGTHESKPQSSATRLVG
ncbi:MAG: flagellar biosynthetic protein FliO [Verrucomicrobia bacterium]|nr:flagellar biosynthetic protein FliO [Verrucomicrobiota bacterium]